MKAAVFCTTISEIILSARRSFRNYERQRSIAGIDNWQEITPDKHHDWIGHRDEAFQGLYPMGF